MLTNVLPWSPFGPMGPVSPWIPCGPVIPWGPYENSKKAYTIVIQC
jgi:hypothetical protein